MSIIEFSSAKCKTEVKPTHSKKLEWIIRDFISQCGYSYYDDEIDRGILKSYYRLENDILVEKEIIIRDYDYLCYTTLSVSLRPDERKNSLKIYNLLAELNDINWQLDYGNFEYNMKTGDIRFRTSYEPNEGLICSEDLDKFIGYSSFAINEFGERILNALKE